MSKRIRLDEQLVTLKLAKNLAQAQAYIWGGLVKVSGQLIDKAGSTVDSNAQVALNLEPFVSRGGSKLAQMLIASGIKLTDKVALDIGAGHGGFSDCLLQSGARKVYAVDVGKPCLDDRLQKDARLIYLPKTNFRDITSEQLPEKVDFFCIDVSFISVKKILPKAVSFLKKHGSAVILIKPQFEAARALVARGGVVRSDELHQKIIFEISQAASKEGLELSAVIPSKIRGKKKHNQEFLAYFKKVI